jgi:uncharacterized protein YebE (UPF0316 family)
MENMLAVNSGFYAWVVLPFLIFAARVIDVSMGTIRVIFISRGLKYLAPVIGFFEILIWLLAIGQIMQNLSNPICYIAYAGGFAMGNFVGISIAEKLSLGVVVIRVITKQDASKLIECLSSADYGVTSIEGQGAAGKVQVVFTIVPRREVSTVIGLVKKFNSKAFYTIEEVGFVESGVFPPKRRFREWRVLDFLWPFRKGK